MKENREKAEQTEIKREGTCRDSETEREKETQRHTN